MTTFRFDDLRQYSDVLRSRSGNAVTVRFVEPRDAAALQNYFRSLTTRSRYNRFLGATSELPPSLLDQFIHIGEADRFSVVATMLVDVLRPSSAKPVTRSMPIAPQSNSACRSTTAGRATASASVVEESGMPRGFVRRRDLSATRCAPTTP